MPLAYCERRAWRGRSRQRRLLATEFGGIGAATVKLCLFPIPSSRFPTVYRQLDDDRIIETLERLRHRIRERFPTSSLARVSEELLAIAHESASHVAYLAKPNWPIRATVGLAIAVMLAVVLTAASQVRLTRDIAGWPEFLQGV